MEKKHYAFTGKTMEVEKLGFTIQLHQIISIRDFEVANQTVKTGTVGGWIQSEKNLVNGSDAWIDEHSTVALGSVITENSLIENSVLLGDMQCTNKSVISNSCIENDMNPNSYLLKKASISFCYLETPGELVVRSSTLLQVEGQGTTFLNILNGVVVEKASNPKLDLFGKCLFIDCMYENVVKGSNVTGKFEEVKFFGDNRLNGQFNVSDSTLKNVEMYEGNNHYFFSVEINAEKMRINSDTNWKNVILKVTEGLIMEETTLSNVYMTDLAELMIFSDTTILNLKTIRFNDEPFALTFSGEQNFISGNEDNMIVLQSSSLTFRDCRLHDSVMIKGYELGIYDAVFEDFASVHSTIFGFFMISNVTLQDSSSLEISGKSNSANELSNHSLKDDEFLIV